MRVKWLSQMARKRILASILAVTVSLPSTGMSLLASGSSVNSLKPAHYSEEIISELQKLCTNGERAVDILEKLRSQGIIDEFGQPIDGGTFKVNGVKMTEDELVEEASKHTSGQVNIDGDDMDWQQVSTMLSVKQSIKELHEFMDEDVDINESNKAEYLESIQSLERDLIGGNVTTYGDPASSTYGAGVSHQARIRISVNNDTIEAGSSWSYIQCTAQLLVKQKVPVSFQYQTYSGSISAERNGIITFEPGETEKKFTIVANPSQIKRNGEGKFYIEFNEVKNALIENGELGGRNLTIPITVKQGDTININHYVDGKITENKWKVGRTERTKHKWYKFWEKDKKKTVYTYYNDITCSIKYKDVEKYYEHWSDNVYTISYSSYPVFDKDDVTVEGKGSQTYNLGRISIGPNDSWEYKTSCSKDKEDFKYMSGISSRMTIKEVHENIGLVGISIPNGTFYAGQIVPITVEFDDRIQAGKKTKLKLADGTVLSPEESQYTQANSYTFAYKVPENSSGSLPAITELSIEGAVSFAGDKLKIRGQNANDYKFDLEKYRQADPKKVMLSNSKCLLRRYKDASFTDIKIKVDDESAGNQWVTEVIKVDQTENGAYRKWIQSNCESISKLDLETRKDLRTGEEVQKALASTEFSAYADQTRYTISEYVKSMYLSEDGGIVRIPFYVVAQNGDTTETNEIPVALIAHYKPAVNTKSGNNLIWTEVFMDKDLGSTYDYILNSNSAEVIFSQTCRGIPVPKSYTLKSAIMAYPGAAKINYSNDNPFLSSWSSLVNNPEDLTTYHIQYDEDSGMVVTDGMNNPTYVDEKESSFTSTNKMSEDGKAQLITLREASEDGEEQAITTSQYEINSPFITNGFHMDTDELEFTAEFEKIPSFYGKKNLIWVSSDESIANVKYPDEYRGENAKTYGENGKAPIEIIPTGKVGNVFFTLYALNDGIKGFTPVEVCRSVTLFCEPGKEPYLRLPSVNGKAANFSSNVNDSLDICFISNLTAQNAQEAKMLSLTDADKMDEYETNFMLDVYETDFKGEPIGEPVYTTTAVSTIKKTIGKLTIPKGILKRTSSGTESVYMVKISADCLKAHGEGLNVVVEKEQMTASAGITVYPSPAKLTLAKLDSYSILDNVEFPISYNLETNGQPVYATSLSVTDSEGNTVFSKALETGEHTLTWNPQKVEGKLKSAYVIKASLQTREGATPTIDSYIVYVYNSNALDILVDSVDGKSATGNNLNEYTLDNHDKIKSLISKDGKTIELDGTKVDLLELSNDISLSAMISINYGDYVWGQISDQIKWETVDNNAQSQEETKDDAESKNQEEALLGDTATTLNYSEGGAYSNITSYSYVSYSPSENFMAVGLDDGKTTITATHARTGMKSSIDINTKTLWNQLFLFKCLPAVKTRLEYINGDKENCVMYTDDNGELALYEESGIISDVHLFSEYNDESYIGTIVRENLLSEEKDISKLQYYPINNYMLRSVSKVELYFQDENGSPYANKNVWIRGGIYRNKKYCYAANLGISKDKLQDGKVERAYKTDENGLITFYADSSQFFSEDEKTLAERTLRESDVITYSFEVKYQPDDKIDEVEKVYEPQMVHVSSMLTPLNFIDDCTATVTGRIVSTGNLTPVVNTQYFAEKESDGEIAEINDIYGYTGAIGLSWQYPKAEVKTEMLLWGEEIKTEPLEYKDRDGMVVSYGNKLVSNKNSYRMLYKIPKDKLILSQMSKTIWYEFADMPVLEQSWSFNKEDVDKKMKAGEVESLNLQVYSKTGVLKTFDCSFRFSNNTHEDAINPTSKNDIQNLLDKISDKLNFPGMLKDEVTSDNLLKYAGKGLSALIDKTGVPLDVEFSPTKDPRCFHLIVTMNSKVEKVNREDVYTDENGNVLDEYSEDTLKVPLKKDKIGPSPSHSNQEFVEDNGIVKSDKTFKPEYRDNSKVKNIFKKTWNWCVNKYKKESADWQRQRAADQAQRNYSKKVGKATITFGGVMYFEVRYGGNNHWDFVYYGGGFNAGFGVNFETTHNFMVGPIPGTVTLSLGLKAGLDFKSMKTGSFEGIENKNSYLTSVEVSMIADAFCGVGWDWGFAALKFGVFGTLTGSNKFYVLNGYNVKYKEKQLEKVNMKGNHTHVDGEIGLRFTVKLLFWSDTYTLCSLYHEFVNKDKGNYYEIEEWWDNAKKGAHTDSSDYSEPRVVSAGFVQEGRAYLEHPDREWVGGSDVAPVEEGEYSLKLMQSNAYTYAEPVYNDDGSMIAYLSDSDSSELEDTLASYAVFEDGKYVNKHGIDPVTYITDELNNETGATGADGKLDPVYDEDGKVINQYRTTERTGYGDTTVRLAGTKDFSVAAWVRQKNSLPDVTSDNASYEDLSAALNQSEISTGVWNGKEWTGFTLTENCVADISPAVAVAGDHAVVAWRSCVASDSSNPTQFDVCDVINARVYDKKTNTWSDTVTLYNGQTGSVHALEVSLMEDGTAIAAYIIKTGKQPEVMTDSEIMYTILNPNGTTYESVRVTNDNNVDQNIQISKVNWNGEEHFILGWLNQTEVASTETSEIGATEGTDTETADSEATNIEETETEVTDAQTDDTKIEDAQEDETEGAESTVQGEKTTVRDVRLLAINRLGLPSSDFLESIHAAGADINGANFRFSNPAQNATLNDLSIMWLNVIKEDSESTKTSNTYVINAMHFAQSRGKIILSSPVEVARMKSGETIDAFSTYGDRDVLHTILESTSYIVDPDDPTTYEIQQIPISGKEGETKNVVCAVGQTNLYTVASKYKKCAVEAEEPYVDKTEIIPGFSIPIGFTVKNTGIAEIEKLKVSLDGKDKEIKTNLLPGESQAISVYYKVPAKKVKDIEYTITADSEEGTSNPEDCTGVIKLNLPEVTMMEAKVVKEEDKARTIQVELDNRGVIPFSKGGKEIMVGLYDHNPEDDIEAKPIEKVMIKDDSKLSLVDNHAYTLQFNLTEDKLDKVIKDYYSEEELKDSNNEIPERDLVLYTKAWVLDSNGEMAEELYTEDNLGMVEIESLVGRYETPYSISSYIQKSEDTVNAEVVIKNNSYANKLKGNLVAVLRDKDGKVISEIKQSYDPTKEDKGLVCVNEEQRKEASIPFTQEDMLKGHKLDEATQISVDFGTIDLGDISAHLQNISVEGQNVGIDEFELTSNENEPKVYEQKKEIFVDGEKTTKKVEIHSNTYETVQELNDEELATLISAVPNNPGDDIKVEVNGKTIAKGMGTQMKDVSLVDGTNTIVVSVQSSAVKKLNVFRNVEQEEKKGKLKVVTVKEQYELNKDGKPIDSEGNEVDLTAEDIKETQEVYVINECVYKTVLKADAVGASGSAALDKQFTVSGDKLLLLKASTLRNKENNLCCRLTWNAISDADGYLVYGAKCNTSKKTYAMKRLAKLKGNGKLSFTDTELKEKQGYKYLVKAYQVKDGKEEVIAVSYVARNFLFAKDSKYSNPSKIIAEYQKVTLDAGMTIKVNAVIKLPKGKKKKKQGPQKRYISTNTKVATVTTSGKIIAKKKGSCYVYVIAQNGIVDKVEVKVK